ncbi:hypothetical protein FEE95_00630 [Maribacter algarum]|uniref:Uncharacterized protein n=1 Tax=Maribacter algarum (ex Zhang et al. 2020) TaxID=2578118 RepID=A0A5S3PSI3_9FLAO|nr:hypothetical protein [Maribacter algarum]TMM57966.1 hypothetical protein FEE95_00630 [Maribacter algarum]
MKPTKNDVVKDLKLLIDISCVEGEDLTMFELFHKMLIRISYKAADISIDYDRKRVYMNVIAEDKYYDLETLNHPFAPMMSVNLVYKDLGTFLKTCIIEDLDSLNYYYPTLISRFFKRTTGEEDLESLQIA